MITTALFDAPEQVSDLPPAQVVVPLIDAGPYARPLEVAGGRAVDAMTIDAIRATSGPFVPIPWRQDAARNAAQPVHLVQVAAATTFAGAGTATTPSPDDSQMLAPAQVSFGHVPEADLPWIDAFADIPEMGTVSQVTRDEQVAQTSSFVDETVFPSYHRGEDEHIPGDDEAMSLFHDGVQHVVSETPESLFESAWQESDPVDEPNSDPSSVVAEPLLTAPLLSAPLLSAPLLSAPLLSAPLLSEPMLFEPMLVEPMLSEPVMSEPMVSEPSMVEAMMVEATMVAAIADEAAVGDASADEVLVSETDGLTHEPVSVSTDLASPDEWPLADSAAVMRTLADALPIAAPVFTIARHEPGRPYATPLGVPPVAVTPPLPMWSDDDLMDIMPVKLAAEAGTEPAHWSGASNRSTPVPSTSAAAALEGIARRVRAGDLAVPGYSEGMSEAAALAAALTALLSTAA